MKKVLNRLIDAICEVCHQVFGNDMGYPPRETKKILDNPHDRKLYLQACENLRKCSKSETITLESGEVLTICSTV